MSIFEFIMTQPRLARCATLALVGATLMCLPPWADADGSSGQAAPGSGPPGSFEMEGVSAWIRDKFSESELTSYSQADFRIEFYQCNCYDRPEPHYPNLLVFFSTPKGDLVGRPDRRGFDTIITRLAVRHGQRYCDLDAEDQCYGSFAHPCEFSDFRYGPQLAEYFPGCKTID